MTREVITTTRRLVDKMDGMVCEAHKVFLNVANGDEAVIIIQTNSTPLQINFHVTADGAFHLKGIQVDSIQTAGTGLGILNHDFRLDPPPTQPQSVTFGNSYSVSSQFYEELVGIGGGGATGGGGNLEEDAWIFAAGTTYALVGENISGVVSDLSFDMDWVALVPS